MLCVCLCVGVYEGWAALSMGSYPKNCTTTRHAPIFELNGCVILISGSGCFGVCAPGPTSISKSYRYNGLKGLSGLEAVPNDLFEVLVF